MVLVPEDELARGDAVAGDSGNRGLCDAVVESERLVIALGSVTALHAAGHLDDAASRVVKKRALCQAGSFERRLRRRVNDKDRMDGRFRGAAQFPFGGIALLGISKDFRSG